MINYYYINSFDFSINISFHHSLIILGDIYIERHYTGTLVHFKTLWSYVNFKRYSYRMEEVHTILFKWSSLRAYVNVQISAMSWFSVFFNDSSAIAGD